MYMYVHIDIRHGVDCKPLQIVHLFLCPHSHHLPGVLLAEAGLEAVIVFDVAIAILEFVESGLEHLHSTLGRQGAVFKTE